MTQEPSNPGVPRWVRWTVIVTLLVAVVLVVVMVTVGGEHGPGRHTGTGSWGWQYVSRALI